jgi:hypothetical protein
VTGSFDAANKEYDATTAAAASNRQLSGAIAGDTVSLSGGTASFNNKNVGQNKPVTLSGATLAGTDAGNYTMTSVAPTTANITAKSLTVSGITASNKVWDGNTSATLNTSAAALNGVITGDVVGLDKSGASGAFASSNVGTWTVQISGLLLTGADKTNYSLTQPATSASIIAWSAQGYGFYAPVGIASSIFTPAPGALPTAKPAGMDWNSAKGGSTVPLKFNVYAGSVEKKNLTDIGSFKTQLLSACAEASLEDPVDITSTGGTSLRYDTTGLQWIQNWQTPKVNNDTCYRASVTFADGSALSAFFKLKK